MLKYDFCETITQLPHRLTLWPQSQASVSYWVLANKTCETFTKSFGLSLNHNARVVSRSDQMFSSNLLHLLLFGPDLGIMQSSIAAFFFFIISLFLSMKIDASRKGVIFCLFWGLKCENIIARFFFVFKDEFSCNI